MDDAFKRLIHLVEAYADNCAAQERVLRQVSRVLTELGLIDDEQPNMKAAKKWAEEHITTNYQWPVGKTITTAKDSVAYGHNIGATLKSRQGNTEIWEEPVLCSGYVFKDPHNPDIQLSADPFQSRDIEAINIEIHKK